MWKSTYTAAAARHGSETKTHLNKKEFRGPRKTCGTVSLYTWKPRREGAQKWIHDTPESGHRILCDLVYNGHHMAGVIYSHELSRMYVGASLTRNVCN